MNHPTTPTTGSLTVTVYSAGPGCKACTLTKRHLERRAIPYLEHPIDDDIRAAATELDITSAPIVCVSVDGVELEPWGGYRPDRIDALTHNLRRPA